MIAKLRERKVSYAVQLDRHEAKYVIPKSLIPEIVEFIRPFCEPDTHAKGTPPEYVVTTLQLDTPDMALHYAKEREALNRFKLRVRTYGEPGDAPVFLEVKRKLKGVIVKSRTQIPFEAWGPELIEDLWCPLSFKSDREQLGFLEFKRLAREVGARPVLLIRYTRESYFSRDDEYARISFDRNLLYQPTSSWNDWGIGGRWIPVDSTLAQRKKNRFSGVVLELKTLSDVPRWMIDLVRHFGLERTGNCKYCNAVWQEALVSGSPRTPDYAQALSL